MKNTLSRRAFLTLIGYIFLIPVVRSQESKSNITKLKLDFVSQFVDLLSGILKLTNDTFDLVYKLKFLRNSSSHHA